MKFLILAQVGDETAVRVAGTLLRRHAARDVRLLSLDEIVLAPRWSHRIDADGVRTALQLHDGTRLEHDDIGVVLNRIGHVHLPHFAGARGVDRDYASMEMFALLLSWLAGLRAPVLNPVSPRNLGGAMLGPVAWQLFAARAGLPVATRRFTSSVRRYPSRDLVFAEPTAWSGGNIPAELREPAGPARHRVLVAGGQVLGGAPAELHEGCRRLAQRAEMTWLELWFSSGAAPGADWIFEAAGAFPTVKTAAEVEAVATMVEEKLGVTV